MASDRTIQSVLNHLAQLEEDYQEWIAPINSLSEKLWRQQGKSLKAIESELAILKRRQLEKSDPLTLINDQLEDLCELYWDCDDKNRQLIRERIDELDSAARCLIGFSYRQAGKLRGQKDSHDPRMLRMLRMGLCALSIENCRLDWRDSLLALAELYLAAEDSGMDPRGEFLCVSKLSSTVIPAGSSAAMRDILRNFKRYGVLDEKRKKPKNPPRTGDPHSTKTPRN